MKVGEKYEVKAEDGMSKAIEVDHTNRIERHRRLSQTGHCEVDA